MVGEELKKEINKQERKYAILGYGLEYSTKGDAISIDGIRINEEVFQAAGKQKVVSLEILSFVKSVNWKNIKHELERLQKIVENNKEKLQVNIVIGSGLGQSILGAEVLFCNDPLRMYNVTSLGYVGDIQKLTKNKAKNSIDIRNDVYGSLFAQKTLKCDCIYVTDSHIKEEFEKNLLISCPVQIKEQDEVFSEGLWEIKESVGRTKRALVSNVLVQLAALDKVNLVLLGYKLTDNRIVRSPKFVSNDDNDIYCKIHKSLCARVSKSYTDIPKLLVGVQEILGEKQEFTLDKMWDVFIYLVDEVLVKPIKVQVEKGALNPEILQELHQFFKWGSTISAKERMRLMVVGLGCVKGNVEWGEYAVFVLPKLSITKDEQKEILRIKLNRVSDFMQEGYENGSKVFEMLYEYEPSKLLGAFIIERGKDDLIMEKIMNTLESKVVPSELLEGEPQVYIKTLKDLVMNSTENKTIKREYLNARKEIVELGIMLSLSEVEDLVWLNTERLFARYASRRWKWDTQYELRVQETSDGLVLAPKEREIFAQILALETQILKIATQYDKDTRKNFSANITQLSKVFGQESGEGRSVVNWASFMWFIQIYARRRLVEILHVGLSDIGEKELPEDFFSRLDYIELRSKLATQIKRVIYQGDGADAVDNSEIGQINILLRRYGGMEAYNFTSAPELYSDLEAYWIKSSILRYWHKVIRVIKDDYDNLKLEEYASVVAKWKKVVQQEGAILQSFYDIKCTVEGVAFEVPYITKWIRDVFFELYEKETITARSREELEKLYLRRHSIE